MCPPSVNTTSCAGHPPVPNGPERLPSSLNVPYKLKALVQYIEQKFPSNVPYPALQALAEYIVTYQDTRPGITSAVVELLHPSRIPSIGYHPLHDNVQAAIGAIEVISSQAKVIVTLGSPRQDIVQLFSESYLHCLEWLRSFCNQGIHIIPSAAFVITMLEVDVGVRNMLMGSSVVVNLVLNMWMQQDEKGRHFLSEGSEERCPLLCLFSCITNDPIGRVTLHDHLQKNPTELECIADTMERRVRTARRLVIKNAMSSPFAIRHLRGLTSIIEQILFKPERSLARFQPHRLLYCISLALDMVLCFEMRASVWIQVPGLLRSLYTLALKSDPKFGSPLENVIELCSGGIVRIILKTLLYVPSTLPGYSFAADFLRNIAGYIAYRKVAPYLIVAVADESVATLPNARHRTPVFDQCWEEVLYAMNAHDEYDGPRVARQMCDSIEHCENPRVEAHEVRSRRCGGCRSAAYCSTRCQKVDWDARHRSECDSLRQLTVSLPVLEADLHVRSGANLAAFVERMCNKHWEAFETFAQRSSSAPLSSLVLVLNAIAAPSLGSISTIVEFFEYVRRAFGGVVPRQQRIHSYLTQMLMVPQVHIAYAVYPLGLSTLHILVRLWKEQGCPLRVMNFMTIGVSERCLNHNPDNVWVIHGLHL